MKLKKLIAIVFCIAMMALMSSVACAEEFTFLANGEPVSAIELGAWGSQWIQVGGLADADLSEAKLVVNLNVQSDVSEMWDGFEVVNVYDGSVPEKITGEGNTSDTEYVFEFDASSWQLDEWGQLAFNIQAGHLTVVIESVVLVLPDEEPTEPAEPPVYAPITVDGDNKTISNVVKIDLASFAGIEADIASIDFTMAPLEGSAWGDGWFGGGFAVGMNTSEAWYEVNYASDKEDEISKGWIETAVVDPTAEKVQCTSDPYSFTFVLPEGTKTPYTVIDEDKGNKSYGKTVSAGIIQFGYWWGSSNNKVDLTEITVNFSDGTSISLIDPASTATYDQEAYQKAMNEIFYKGEEIVKVEKLPAEDPTDAPTDAPATAPDADANAGNDQPQTGDNGIAVLAVVAMISLAGAVVVKKHNA